MAGNIGLPEPCATDPLIWPPAAAGQRTVPSEVIDESDGRRRVAIEAVRPAVEGGRFAIKRVVGDTLVVTADVMADGHDAVECRVNYRRQGQHQWQSVPMQSLGNDAWQASIRLDEIGRYEYVVEGWVDRWETWRRDLDKRRAAGQDVGVELQVGADLLAYRAEIANGDDRRLLDRWRVVLPNSTDALARLDSPEGHELWTVALRYPDRRLSVSSAVHAVVVERPRAVFGSWYELFPRSTATVPGKHGTLSDCIARLPYVASMGFDVVYLPPIHPIGRSFRKGKNNAHLATAGESGCPWAIGSADGGHKSVHPELGTLADFRRLVAAAERLGMEIALDFACQCSPDHPYVKEHPEWFRARPDGTIQYAENPPKKYEDIYPFDFETPDWRSLWQELLSVFEFWIEQGVRIFRVDNPHTKPFAFWEWLIDEVKSRHPDTIFLSEAFTRPKVMYRLAKLGFTQSYTYFTWRNTKQELIDYFLELSGSELSGYFRPNLWPNTPDILPEHLQRFGRPAAIARLIMAATLGANYGMYGPVYELCENQPREPGSEEYLDSEKYEIRHWNLDRPDSLAGIIAKVNRARRENPALQSYAALRFHPIENDQLLVYSKGSLQEGNLVLVAVNLDFGRDQGGWLTLPLAELGLSGDRPYRICDQISGEAFEWQGARNYVRLDPRQMPAHLFRVEQ